MWWTLSVSYFFNRLEKTLGNETEITAETAETSDSENKTKLWNDHISMKILTPTLPPPLFLLPITVSLLL